MSDQTKKMLPWAILIGGALSVVVGMGIRASFGLFLNPMSLDLGWGREVFALALAIQNLMWGAFQPFASAAADKWGSGRVVALGGLLYAGGLTLMSVSTDPLAFQLSAGLMIGAAQSGCALAVVLAAVGRAMPPEKRSLGLGLVTAVGAAGQFSVVPLGQVFLVNFGWSQSYLLLAAVSLFIFVGAFLIRDRTKSGATMQTVATSGPVLGMVETLRLASRHRGYWLLTTGFFVCGFHVAFIAVHLPAYLTDLGMPPGTGAWSLSLIGLFNVIGAFSAGILGGKRSKKYLLSGLYALRSVTILVFILMPISTASVLVFSIAMGLLWLSTVPLTSGLVAQIFGIRYMGTLFAIVFFSHQVGSFLGVWLGGVLYDVYGTYMPVWWAGVALGLVSALLHLPINDQTAVDTEKAVAQA